MPVRGSCHCGRIAYSLDTEPTEAIECNCSICRRRGSVLAAFTPDLERRTAFQVHRGNLVVNCETQQEVDELWDRLAEGGQTQQCGWLKDRFGLSRQIVPTVLMELINDPDPGRSRRVTEAMLQMTKIDIAKLKQAYEEQA